MNKFKRNDKVVLTTDTVLITFRSVIYNSETEIPGLKGSVVTVWRYLNFKCSSYVEIKVPGYPLPFYVEEKDLRSLNTWERFKQWLS